MPIHEDEYGRRHVVFRPVAPTLETRATRLRRRRNTLLELTDWRETVGTPNGETDPEAWITYRQALRDITGQPGWPEDVTWPTPPEPIEL